MWGCEVQQDGAEPDSLPPDIVDYISSPDSAAQLLAIQRLGDRSYNPLCDCVTRPNDGVQIWAHRASLCTTSPFFRALFRFDPGRIVLLELRAPVLEALLTFHFTEELSLKGKNTLDILNGADMPPMQEAPDVCLEHLLRGISINSCLSLAALAQRYYSPKFRKAVLVFVREHFDAVCQASTEYPKTSSTLLRESLASDELNVAREVDLLCALQQWASGSGTQIDDIDAMSVLPKCVRIDICNEEDLERVQPRCPSLAQSRVFQAAVDDALKRGPCRCSPGLKPESCLAAPERTVAISANMWKAVQSASCEAPDFSHRSTAEDPGPVHNCSHCGGCAPERWLPRMPYETLFGVGGWGRGQQRCSIEAYDLRTPQWILHSNNEFESRASHGVVEFGTHIYVVGDFTNCTPVRWFNSLDTERCTWEKRSPMQLAWAYPSVISLGEHIYAICRYTATQRTDTMECYSSQTNQWTMVGPMNRVRSDAAACIFKVTLYVPGAFTAWSCTLAASTCTADLTDSIRRIRSWPRSQEDALRGWQDMRPMKVTRSTFAVVQLGDDIYVIGALDGFGLMTEVGRYSASTDTWHAVAPLNEPLSALDACVIKGIAASRRFFAERSPNF
ncbi:kelch-like protein 10 [Haemaphysalis longicornis]